MSYSQNETYLLLIDISIKLSISYVERRWMDIEVPYTLAPRSYMLRLISPAH